MSTFVSSLSSADQIGGTAWKKLMAVLLALAVLPALWPLAPVSAQDGVGEDKPTIRLVINLAGPQAGGTCLSLWGVLPQDERQPELMIGNWIGISPLPARSSAWFVGQEPVPC
jgi:hypothetical protein